MVNDQDKIDRLSTKLEVILKQQEEFSREINELRSELISLKHRGGQVHQLAKNTVSPTPQTSRLSPKVKSDLERFIGENLINKIGIVIIVFGVAIGAKYSFERDLISPVMRLALGYLMGVGLLGMGWFLKRKYASYSAVLVSGAMAIMYFITYFGYNYYTLIPQGMAFVLMLVFTIATALAAIRYNRQVIAHIGFTGAYAVPFLLSDGTGEVTILFVYMAMINIGILVVAFRKYWKSLYYASFGFTWLIYFGWFVSAYQPEEHFRLALVFLTLFFVIFYLTALVYKLRRYVEFGVYDIILVLTNAFVFYGIGYAILEHHGSGNYLLGAFTLMNALVHFVVSAGIYQKKLADRNLIYLTSGLMLVFITLAFPVQFNGNWVTLLWAGEAAVLFRIGRIRKMIFYEQLAVVLMGLTFFSLLHDWSMAYTVYDPAIPETRIFPLFNIQFLSSLLVIIAFGFVIWLNLNREPGTRAMPLAIRSYFIPALAVLTVYGAFQVEIATFWSQLQADAVVAQTDTGEQAPGSGVISELEKYKVLWIINFTLLFVALLSLANIQKFKNQAFGLLNLGLSLFIVIIFLVHGLYLLSELREAYLAGGMSAYYLKGVFRYLSYPLVAFILVTGYQQVRQVRGYKLVVVFDLWLYTTILWIASSELIHWMDIIASVQSYKLGLSILWGMYALLLIVLGIWKQKKHLRIGAILLFMVTLVKLFFFDISHLDTIARTVVFVLLGIVLLVISFLYNKYKHIISG